MYEGDERFWLRLVEPTGSSAPITLGPQRTTVITIRDNDQPLTGYVSTFTLLPSTREALLFLDF